MKPHLVVQLQPDATAPDAPYWADLVRDDRVEPGPFRPAVDRVLLRHDAPALVTREYRPAGSTWSPEEVAAGLDRVYRLVLLSRDTIPPDLIADIQLLPEIARAEPGRIASMPLPEAQARGSGPHRDWARDVIQLGAAHQLSRGSRDIVVAVLDTGVATDHPELRDVLADGADFVDIIDGATDFIGDYLGADHDPSDEVGHGTHVAGIIAGAGLRMPTGVAPGVTIVPVRVLAAMRRGSELRGAGLVDNINAGVKWAVDAGVDVINMSLGVRHTGGGLPHREVVDYASRRGVTIVAASGNDGTDQHYYPGAFPYVVTVGAVERDDSPAAFSTYGRHVDLVAPGSEIYSSSLANAYAYATGTSHAAPFVAGTVALLKSHAAAHGARYPDRVCKRALRATADRPGARLRDLHQGFGRVNVADALRYVTHDLQRSRRR